MFLEFAAEVARHRLWYEKPLLLKLIAIFRVAFSCETLPDDFLLHLMDLFSLSPKSSAEYFLPVPFFKYDHRYLRYPGYQKIMSSQWDC